MPASVKPSGRRPPRKGELVIPSAAPLLLPAPAIAGLLSPGPTKRIIGLWKQGPAFDPVKPREHPLLIYCADGNRSFAEIALRHGYEYGACLPNTIYLDPYFTDQDWRKFNKAKSPEHRRSYGRTT
jgi:hypothetical protein